MGVSGISKGEVSLLFFGRFEDSRKVLAVSPDQEDFEHQEEGTERIEGLGEEDIVEEDVSQNWSEDDQTQGSESLAQECRASDDFEELY